MEFVIGAWASKRRPSNGVPVIPVLDAWKLRSASMVRLIGTNHVAVEVADTEEAIAFFERIFGPLPLRGRGRHMAFIDMGDQFIALEATPEAAKGSHPRRVQERHVGLVVDDREAALAAARAAGATIVGGNDIVDPWGNRWQIVDYRDVQYTKTPRILAGMGVEDLEKSERALDELRAKNLAD
jgi:catechol 2,3-dioxygenase-like lactoylglutathione lyase family enzyme